jgi:hypothetical protein
MILDLAHVHGLSIKAPVGFEAALKAISSERDLLAHGVWSVDNGQYLVVKTSGSWGKNESTEERRKRKIKPGAHYMTIGIMAAVHAEVVRG